jgi:hypothetical protein
MKPFSLVVVFALVLGACGGSVAGGELLPTVTITRLDVDGVTATLEFTAEDDSGPVIVAVDWGDGSDLETFVVSGESAATHDYSPDVTEAVVTLIATDEDDQEVRTGRTLTFSPSGSVTTTTSTSTTAPETTTTSSPTTTSSTTTNSTTTTTTTTTTLPPEALEQVYELSVHDADYVSEFISPLGANASTATVGNRVDLFAETAGFDGGIIARSRIEWLIPEDEWTQLGLEPQLSVLMEGTYSVKLSTGPNPGRAASFDFKIAGLNGAESLGEGTWPAGKIGAGDSKSDDDIWNTIGFGAPLSPNASGPIQIVLEAWCSVSPGSTVFQVAETSTCHADVWPSTIVVTLTRNEGT